MGETRYELLRAWSLARQVLANPEAPDDIKAKALLARDAAEAQLLLQDANARRSEQQNAPPVEPVTPPVNPKAATHPLLLTADRALSVAGESIASQGLLLASVALFLLVFAGGIAMSVLVGVAACEIFGGGFFTFALVGFLFLLFLSIYVWEPHVRQAVERAADVLTGGV